MVCALPATASALGTARRAVALVTAPGVQRALLDVYGALTGSPPLLDGCGIMGRDVGYTAALLRAGCGGGGSDHAEAQMPRRG